MFLFSSIDLLYGAIVSQVFTIFKNGACSCVRDATIMVQVRDIEPALHLKYRWARL